VLSAGSGIIDINDNSINDIYSRLIIEINDGNEVLVDSKFDSLFKYDWPEGINNIIAVPLYGKEKSRAHLQKNTKENNCIIGLTVAVNRVGKYEFDNPDIKLFNSVANSCAVFIENGRLFNDLKTLFIGSLKALTSSIDAKDQYTRGHSERVAFISRWIAERLTETENIDSELIHKIYLAGLLHDIGKIGVTEAILCKDGQLTSAEALAMKAHPSIGAGILSDIKQMNDIIPGVLYHHEQVDGHGYPEGLKGDKIPLIGKIIGLADSFDAMTSKRTYREAMSLDGALQEIKQKLGTQFDEKVGNVFLYSDVLHLWEIMQDGFTSIYEMKNASDYDTMSVGMLIK